MEIWPVAAIFAFLDFYKNLKVFLLPVIAYYRVAVTEEFFIMLLWYTDKHLCIFNSSNFRGLLATVNLFFFFFASSLVELVGMIFTTLE